MAWAILQVLDFLDKSAPVLRHPDLRDWDPVAKISGVSTARGRRLALLAVAPMVQAQLRADQQVAADAVLATGGDPAAVDAILAEQKAEWDKLFRLLYVEAGVPAARRVDAGIRRVTESVAKAVTLGPEDAPWVEGIYRWLKDNSSERIVAILDSTREQVRDQLAEGNAAGENIRQLANRIRATDSTAFSRERAEVIARTESLTAYSVGSNTAAVESEVDMDKVWATNMDGRQRPSHGAANRQRQALKDPYQVGGAELMFPGDSSLGAPAAETIQCRCTELYVPV